MCLHHFEFPSLDRRDVQKNHINSASPIRQAGMLGCVMGSHVDSKEIGFKPKRYAYPRCPTHPCWTKNWSETLINPTILQHILQALFFVVEKLGSPAPWGPRGPWDPPRGPGVAKFFPSTVSTTGPPRGAQGPWARGPPP